MKKILTPISQKELSVAEKILGGCWQGHQKKNASKPMIGVTEKTGRNKIAILRKSLAAKKFFTLLSQRSATHLLGNQVMTAFVFIFVYYLGKPLFINLGVSDRNRFFMALALGLLLETVVFAITGISGYKLMGPM